MSLSYFNPHPAIRPGATYLEWVPLVAELMDKKEKSRDELLSLLA